MALRKWVALFFWLLLLTGPAVADVVQAELDSAFAALIRGNLPQATIQYRDILDRHPDLAEAHRNLGWLMLVTRRDEIQHVEAHLKRAVELDPGNAGAHSDLGFAYVYQNNYGPALRAFEQAVALSPGNLLFLKNLGMAAVEAGSYPLAEASFRQAANLGIPDDTIWYGLGNALARQGKDEEALDAYRRALMFNPHRIEAHMGMGDIFSRQGNIEEAVAAFERAVQIDIYVPRPHYALMGLYRRMGDTERARQALARFRYLEEEQRYAGPERHIYPVHLDRVAAAAIMGHIFARVGRYEEALAHYKQGLAVADSAGSPFGESYAIPSVRLAMAQTYQGMGEVKKARENYQTLVDLLQGFPEEEMAALGLADLYLCTEGVPKEEFAGYERAVAMESISDVSFWIYDRLSQYHLDAGALEHCIEQYGALRDRVPMSAGLRVRLGVAYAAAGNLDQAAQEYRHALYLADSPNDLYPQLAELYRRAGRATEADSISALGGR